jgi:hypothetical protein
MYMDPLWVASSYLYEEGRDRDRGEGIEAELVLEGDKENKNGEAGLRNSVIFSSRSFFTMGLVM